MAMCMLGQESTDARVCLIFQYGHVYAWAREHGRKSVSMRFAYKYPFFHITHTRYHRFIVYFLAKYAAKLHLMTTVEYTSFKNEQLYDVVGGTGTACDGRYINRVEFTADAKGVRTCVYCFDDDLGQR